MWATVTVNGSSPTGPPSGTVLSKLLPASVPITGVYHFTQFGRFQPYLGAGIAPTFALAVRDGFSTGSTYQPALGVVVQGGFDYMLNKHWGVFVDAKQGFVGTTGNSTGVNTAPSLGPITRHDQNQRPACRVLDRLHLSLLAPDYRSPRDRRRLRSLQLDYGRDSAHDPDRDFAPRLCPAATESSGIWPWRARR